MKTKINRKYTHFAILKSNNLVVNGWEYKGYDQSELMEFKRDYFFEDIKDMQVEPKIVKIVTAKALLKMGIDPFNSDNWSNDPSIFTL